MADSPVYPKPVPPFLTVVIRDVAPLMHLNEPCAYRTVHIALTEEQQRELALGKTESINSCFFELAGRGL